MRANRVKALGLSLSTLLLSAGCTGGSHDRGVPDAGGRTYARLAITLTAAREGNVTIGTSARLLRYRGIDVESAQVLAGSPSAAREPAVGAGRCAIVNDEALLDDALATSPPDASVQMLDAGELLVQVAGQTLKIAPRYVPDIVPFVSGVIYDAELSSLEPVADGAPLGGDEAYISAFGGQQIGRFVAPAEVPAAPRLTALNGGPVDGRVERYADLSLAWTPDADLHGQLQVVLAGEHGPVVRCAVADTGRFTIPASLAGRVADAVHGDPMTLTLERSRRTPFSAPGLESADVEVTVRDLVTLR